MVGWAPSFPGGFHRNLHQLQLAGHLRPAFLLLSPSKTSYPWRRRLKCLVDFDDKKRRSETKSWLTTQASSQVWQVHILVYMYLYLYLYWDWELVEYASFLADFARYTSPLLRNSAVSNSPSLSWLYLVFVFVFCQLFGDILSWFPLNNTNSFPSSLSDLLHSICLLTVGTAGRVLTCICICLTPAASRQVPRCQTYLLWFSRWPQSQTRCWSPLLILDYSVRTFITSTFAQRVWDLFKRAGRGLKDQFHSVLAFHLNLDMVLSSDRLTF